MPEETLSVASKSQRGISLRFLVRLCVIVSACVVAGWWCFREQPPPHIPGTVRSVSFKGDVWKAVSHTRFGVGVFGLGSQQANASREIFLSEKLKPIDIEISLLGGRNGRTIWTNQSSCHEIPDRRLFLIGNAGVAIYDIAERTGQAAALRLHDDQWRNMIDVSTAAVDFDGGSLIAYFSGADTRDTPATWQARYDLSSIDAKEAVLFPAELNRLPITAKPIAILSAGNGTEWAALEFLRLNVISQEQEVTYSDGTIIELPVEQHDDGASRSSSIYFDLISIDGIDRMAGVRMTADHEAIELVEIVRGDSDAQLRLPLKLPTRYINTKISEVGPNGRYVALISADFRTNRVPFLSRWFPQLQSVREIHDLVLVDLIDWKVAAAKRVERTKYGRAYSNVWNEPTISHDGQQLLVPRSGGVDVVDIDQWRRNCDE